MQKSQLIATQTLLDFAHWRHNTDCGFLVSHFATHGAFSTIICLRPPPPINCSVRIETFEAGHIDVLTLQWVLAQVSSDIVIEVSSIHLEIAEDLVTAFNSLTAYLNYFFNIEDVPNVHHCVRKVHIFDPLHWCPRRQIAWSIEGKTN